MRAVSKGSFFEATEDAGELVVRCSSDLIHVARAVELALRFVSSNRPKGTVLDEFGFRLMLHEALTNAVIHGNRCEQQKRVQCCVSVDGNAIEFAVSDEGPGFNPGEAPREWETDTESGRGLLLIRAYADEVTHNASGNEIRVRKVLGPSSAAMGESQLSCSHKGT